MNKILMLILASVLALSLQTAFAVTDVATFAMGCFWCAQADFDKVNGVTKTIVGFTGGTEANPTYQDVSQGKTGHYEAIQVYYDPAIVTYPEILAHFWHNVDPLNPDGQFCDSGSQYRAVIFYANPEQKKLAEASKAELMKTAGFEKVATQILPVSTFYPAEDYHQSYYKKKTILYNIYRYSCGRDGRLMELWGAKK